MNPDSQDVLQSGFKNEVRNSTHDSASQDAVLKAGHDYDTSEYKKVQMEEMTKTKCGDLSASQVPFHMHQMDPPSDHIEPGLGELTGIPAVGVPAAKRAEISMDIDSFPRDYLSEIFSRGTFNEDRDGVSVVHKYGAYMNVMMENHEPKHWSYFQKMTGEEFADRCHLDSPSLLVKVKEVDQKPNHFAASTTEGVPVSHNYSQLNFGEDNNKKNLLGVGATDSTVLSDLNHSQVEDGGRMQFSAMMENLRSHGSGYEGGMLENENFSLPQMDPSLEDVSISTLQIIKNEDLVELRELASGTSRTVYHGKWRGTDVAIKRLNEICFTSESSEQEKLTVEFWREAEILSLLHHPNVVTFYGVVQDGPGGTLAAVAEYMVDGSLRNVLLKKDRYLNHRERLLIAMDVAFGMEYLHSKNIVHFGLKCDNLLVNLKDPQKPICKICDFSLSKIKRNTTVSGGVLGSLPWMAPELLNASNDEVSEKVDVYSFGIVLWEILTGEEPYANIQNDAITAGIVNNTLRPVIPKSCEPEWKTLMEQCWAPNPETRPSFTEIVSHLAIMLTTANQTKGHD